MKALRAQSKAVNAARLSRIVGRPSGAKVGSGDADHKVTAKSKKRPVEMGVVEGKAVKPRLDRPGRKMKRAAGGYIPLEPPPPPSVWSPTPKDWVPFEDDIVKRAPNLAGRLDFDKMDHYEQPVFQEWNRRQQIENVPGPKWRTAGGRVKLPRRLPK